MSTPNRPLSPHLQIYRPQMTSILSITHRMSGVALTAGAALIAFWLLAVALGPETYATAVAICTSWLGSLVMIGFAAALFFHLCNGIRHLFWDAGYGYDLDAAQRSGILVLVATAVMTALAIFMAMG